ncbi:putative phosphomevalonate kinase [Sclerotinia borealis F-4128]|uniref:Phosphomevalonate kinase n=1 Tax=Sclerotinia borealis (strain F-4128) TaxID=1432307 RepID=W9CSZ2_SCLBF|nr:putative phosphomevalonate kinase [Sclerotinia borealis F-4128]
MESENLKIQKSIIFGYSTEVSSDLSDQSQAEPPPRNITGRMMTTPTPPQITAVSAPGKVFLAGGYLVLDREYTALVFGLSARIHVLVQDIDTSTGVQLSEIIVKSPQFREAAWNYGYHLTKDDGGIEVTQLHGSPTATPSRNPFVETALLYALTYISSLLPISTTIKPTTITILADKDYYSNPSSTSIANDAHHQFLDFGVRLQDAHKTGLGSSAALVTAFTGAILTHYLPPSKFSLDTPNGKSQLHNLAQAAHCAAQGKVGSGFDIATAVYGTSLYRRFSPSLLSSLGEPGSPGFSTRVKCSVQDTASPKWDAQIESGKISIPQGMALVMCDVDCGSQTVGMVKSVLEWRAREPVVSKKLWDELQTRNEKLATILSSGDIAAAGNAFSAIREKIREMGKLSGVPIEPEEQTKLLDAVTENVEGVVGGVVPGAGGYDAIVLLVRDDEETMEGIKRFLREWSREQGSNVKLLGVKGEMEGARREEGGLYGRLLV